MLVFKLYNAMWHYEIVSQNTKHHHLHLFQTDANLHVLQLIVQIKNRAGNHWLYHVLAHVVLLVCEQR